MWKKPDNGRGKSIGTEGRIVVAQGWGRGQGRGGEKTRKDCLENTGFLRGDANVLGLNSSDGCAAL